MKGLNNNSIYKPKIHKMHICIGINTLQMQKNIILY
jgi:hypothetical protein